MTESIVMGLFAFIAWVGFSTVITFVIASAFFGLPNKKEKN
tara:strand:+ start:615 stop:737 length:123 start_codon:yes stop_codon:yes gene_type:complete